jgi:hypothetical protein
VQHIQDGVISMASLSSVGQLPNGLYYGDVQ